MGYYIFMRTYIAPYKGRIAVLAVFGLLASAFSLLVPLISNRVVDQALLGRDLSRFLSLTVSGGVLFIITVAFTTIQNYIRVRYGFSVSLRLSREFLRKIFSMNLAFFQSENVKEQAYAVFDVDGLQRVILDDVTTVIVDLLKLPVIIAISFHINARMTLFLLACSPLFLLKTLYFRKKLYAIYERLWSRDAAMSNRIYDALNRIYIIKSFGLERHVRNGYLSSFISGIRLKMQSFGFETTADLVSVFMSKAIFGAMALYGGVLIIKGRLSLGEYTAVMMYLASLGGIVQALAGRFQMMSRGMVSWKKFDSVMSLPPVPRPQGLKWVSHIASGVELRGISFAYGTGRPVLDNVAMSIPSGSWLALAGPSGCGKTTLVNLLLGHYAPLQGMITIDGIDCREIDRECLRKSIALACQQPFLFCGTVRENILSGLKVDDAELIRWSKAACLHEYVGSLPLGYETVIGEDGAIFSSGLKQRVAVARALIRRPEILILDEAVSAVDSATEKRILDAVRAERPGKITVMVSHRLSAFINADSIYFFGPDGIARGSHAELMADPGYRAFVKEQIIREGAPS